MLHSVHRHRVCIICPCTGCNTLNYPVFIPQNAGCCEIESSIKISVNSLFSDLGLRIINAVLPVITSVISNL